MARKKNNRRRHSEALEADLIQDPQENAEAEARNGLRQFDLGMSIVEDALAKKQFRLRPSLVLSLHRAALEGINAYAGNYRPGGVEIEGSKHEPVGAHLVPELVEDMCDYVNENWDEATAIHLAAYLMWRFNWIHPFADGNGRTSRIISYVALCIKLGFVLPGLRTIPEQIESDRNAYFEALDAADAAYADGEKVNVSKMEDLLGALLATQLTTLYEKASGKPIQ
ncbi:MAG: Fic family protein [Hyphomicrobiaceae bacterium]|nr:Fic family protein [Hyphomicrobiaceae bacterium]